MKRSLQIQNIPYNQIEDINISTWKDVGNTLYLHYLKVITAMGAVVQLAEYRTRNQEVASSSHTRSTTVCGQWMAT